MISESDAAWMAGLFEGEGNISIQRTSVRLQLRMNDLDVVESWQKRAGCGTIKRYSDPRPNAQDHYYWCISRRSEVTRLLTTLLPWLGNRRGNKATEALAFIQSFDKQLISLIK